VVEERDAVVGRRDELELGRQQRGEVLARRALLERDEVRAGVLEQGGQVLAEARVVDQGALAGDVERHGARGDWLAVPAAGRRWVACGSGGGQEGQERGAHGPSDG